ncbi:MAG: hypothetical protein ACTSO9_19405 [Candidatus Helarchaeota archaeon]
MERVDLEKIISGVAARKVILACLLDGPKTGSEIRWALADSFDRRIDGVSDTLLYFNLQHLENANIISRKKEWKLKYSSIHPNKIQSIRRYFHKIVPITIIGAIDDDVTVIRKIRNRLRVEKSMSTPQKYFFMGPEKLKRKVAGLLPDVNVIYIPNNIYEHPLELKEFIKSEVLDPEIMLNEVVIDISSGTRVCSLTLLSLAYEYGLRCIYLDENEKLTWIID